MEFERDPRVDPKRGDVLLEEGECVVVVYDAGDHVRLGYMYDVSDSELPRPMTVDVVTLEQWRSMQAEGVVVLRRAP